MMCVVLLIIFYKSNHLLFYIKLALYIKINKMKFQGKIDSFAENNLGHGPYIEIPEDVYKERSEERRVGKEYRSRWSPYHKKKKIFGMNLSYWQCMFLFIVITFVMLCGRI